MAGFVLDNDSGFSSQLTNFNSKIGSYAALLGVTTQELNSIDADATYLKFVVQSAASTKAFAQAWTALKDRIRDGGADSDVVYPIPVNLASPPAPVAPGIEKRFRAMAARLKTHPNYSQSIGEDLGIVAKLYVKPILSPKLILKMVGTSLVIFYKKGAAHGVHIFSKRGNESEFTLLAIDMRSPYVDNRPNLEEGVPEKRSYYAFYFKDDALVGTQGPEVNILV